MTESIASVPELIEAFGGPSAFARVIGKGPSTAGEMKRSGRIDAGYWVRIVDAARVKNINGISYELLARLHARADGVFDLATPSMNGVGS